MDSSSIVRPAGQTAQSGSSPPSVRGAVPASLSAAQSVTAAAKPADVRAEDNFHVRQVVLDAQSREVIHQALDTARRLVRQPTEETRQRLRAYARRRAISRDKSEDHLDLEV